MKFDENYLKDNLFMALSKDSLKSLWEGYKRAVYEVGWYEPNNPMLPYIMYYQSRFCETMLLEAIAFKFIEEA